MVTMKGPMISVSDMFSLRVLGSDNVPCLVGRSMVNRAPQFEAVAGPGTEGPSDVTTGLMAGLYSSTHPFTSHLPAEAVMTSLPQRGRALAAVLGLLAS